MIYVDCNQAIGNRMWDLLSEENSDRFAVIHQVKDDKRKQELRHEEDEEDFLDEGISLNKK